MSETEKSQLVNETQWQYYGTTSTRDALSITWNASVLPTNHVSIELWGYEETGGALCGLPVRDLVPVWDLVPVRDLVGSEALGLQR